MSVLDGALRRLKQRVLNVVARGVVTLVNDAVAGQLLQLRALEGETRDMVQRVQSYGLTSVPLPGAYPVVLLCAAGDRSQAVAVAVDDVRHRPVDGLPGDVALYDHRGNRVRLIDGAFEITAVADLTVAVAGNVAISVTGTASVNVSGNVTLVSSGSATIQTSGALNLGGVGGPAVARLGDQVTIPSVGVGTITSASAKVKAV